MKRSGPTNQNMKQLIAELRKESNTQQTNIWKRIATDLEKPTRQRRVVNLSRIDRFTKENEVIVVPGKVLGAGVISHPVVIAAFSFSQSARDRITAVKGTCMTITELMKQKPKGTDIKIIG